VFDHERLADYCFALGRDDGKADGLFYGGCWGFIAGMLTSFLLIWIWR
jgi:tetrahydromethanopterin S-methyltransferase subunit F